jgi:hypothetical protein
VLNSTLLVSIDFQEIVLHTLFENGTKKISELEAYILDDVEQYGQKVEVLKGKMEETFLKAVDVRPPSPSLFSLIPLSFEMMQKMRTSS